MLFILTGNVQTGKTRWLQDALGQLEALGTEACGVMAPGDWVERSSSDGTVSYEKLGIFNELLPQHERIVFARRGDLVDDSEREASCSQASRAKLSWAISDEAIRRVNDHLLRVARTTAAFGESNSDAIGLPACEGEAHTARAGRRILIVDELGRLEILHGTGLTSALSLVDRGATPALPHALVVVREQLLQAALERFADAPWNGLRTLRPSPEALDTLLHVTTGTTGT